MEDSVNYRDRSRYRRPSRGLVFAEGPRAASEFAALWPAAPVLAQGARGDGHPVLVMPGLGGGDGSTTVLRGYLSSLGHGAQPWNLGTNRGPSMEDLLDRLVGRFEELADAGRGKVSLVGWSLGGVYARLLAQLFPERVRQVVTLGSPFATFPADAVPQSRMDRLRQLAGEPLKNIPSTAIFSKTDVVVPWQVATQAPGQMAENIEVYASHFGLGFNPTVLYALADRLAHAEGEWRPFDLTGLRRFIYGAAELEEDHQPTAGQRTGI